MDLQHTATWVPMSEACVATQGPLRLQANEMLRSLHHQRATLQAAKDLSPVGQVQRAQLMAERQLHAHCVAENLHLKEKLRASLERKELLAKQLQEMQAKLQQATIGDMHSLMLEAK